MKNTKKLFATLMILGMPFALTLTSCGNNQPEEQVSESTVVEEKVTFKIIKGEYYEAQVTTMGIRLDANGEAKVKQGTSVSFIINLLPGHESLQYVVKSNGTTLTKNADQSYTVSVTADTTITVEFAD